MSIIDEIKQRVPTNTVIPKPAARSNYVVKGWGQRRGEDALIYRIPNHKNPHRPHEKGITVSEWEQAYQRISSGEPLTREWFNQTMPRCAKEDPCNFTSIGGIFELLGLVEYRERGLYEPI